MSPRPGSRLRPLTTALLLAAAWSAGAAAAQAQVCETSAVAASCRLVLSRPQTFTVSARYRPLDARQGLPRLAVAVNGHACASTSGAGWFGHARAACRRLLPAGVSVVDVRATQPGELGVRVVADNRLAELPREVKDLDPPRHGDWWSRLPPFP